jgi:hypothetical protein
MEIMEFYTVKPNLPNSVTHFALASLKLKGQQMILLLTVSSVPFANIIQILIPLNTVALLTAPFPRKSITLIGPQKQLKWNGMVSVMWLVVALC